MIDEPQMAMHDAVEATTNSALMRVTEQNPMVQLWLVQVAGWLGLCVVTFLSLTVWYQNIEWPHIAHTVLQALLGMLLSFIMLVVCRHEMQVSLARRWAITLLAVILVAGIWTALRIITFMWLTGESGLWSDFGGWYFASFIVFSGWTAAYYGISYYHRLHREHEKLLLASESAKEAQLQITQAESVAKESQLRMLRYQLNPHFICNTLNAINALIRFEESDKAEKMIVQLSQLMRNSLDNNPQLEITLEQEINTLMLYLEIEKTRFEDRLTLDFEIEERAKLAKIPSLLLQPLIENSVKHAIAPNEEGGTIRLRARVIDGDLVLELSDTGLNRSLDNSKLRNFKGRGVGLRNTTERLELLYKDESSFKLDIGSSGGLTATIRLPYRPVGDKALFAP